MPLAVELTRQVSLLRYSTNHPKRLILLRVNRTVNLSYG